MLLLFTTIAVAAPTTRLAVCDSGGVAYLGKLSPVGFERVTADGTQEQLEGLLKVPWTVHATPVVIGPPTLSALEASFQVNSWSPSDERAHPGQQILLGPCSEPGAVYVDQSWSEVKTLTGHQIEMLEPSNGLPVLKIDDTQQSLGTRWDETGTQIQEPKEDFQILRRGDEGLVVAPIRGPFSRGWLIVSVGEETHWQRVETENSWD